MKKITIIIKGIAMSYHKNDGLWRILFPFGECHEIKFKEHPKDTGITLADENRQIRITAENPNSKFETGDNYNDFLDLTGEYSHLNGVKMSNKWEDHGVLMTVENAKMSVHEYAPDKHLVMKEQRVTMPPSRIAYSAKLEIVCEKIKIDVDNHPDFPKVFDKDCVLTFDNDCEQEETRETTDFELIYKVVEDAKIVDQKFEVAKPSKIITVPIVVGTVLKKTETETNPKDPFASGLPCHKVRVSNSNGLV